MEKLDQVDIVRVLLEVLLQEKVDRRLENEGIVDSNVADSLLSTLGEKDERQEREKNGSWRVSVFFVLVEHCTLSLPFFLSFLFDSVLPIIVFPDLQRGTSRAGHGESCYCP